MISTCKCAQPKSSRAYYPAFLLKTFIFSNVKCNFFVVPTTLLSDLAKNRTTVNMVTCGRSQNVLERKVGYTFFGALFFCFLVLLSVVFLVICIKKSGIPRKNRRTITESQAALGSETTHIDARYSRTCVAGGRTPLTYIIEEDEAPPPYYLDGMFVDDIESPPPYTSRPTSINGDFV